MKAVPGRSGEEVLRHSGPAVCDPFRALIGFLGWLAALGSVVYARVGFPVSTLDGEVRPGQALVDPGSYEPLADRPCRSLQPGSWGCSSALAGRLALQSEGTWPVVRMIAQGRVRAPGSRARRSRSAAPCESSSSGIHKVSLGGPLLAGRSRLCPLDVQRRGEFGKGLAALAAGSSKDRALRNARALPKLSVPLQLPPPVIPTGAPVLSEQLGGEDWISTVSNGLSPTVAMGLRIRSSRVDLTPRWNGSHLPQDPPPVQRPASGAFLGDGICRAFLS